jgi:hypothetical protein
VFALWLGFGVLLDISVERLYSGNDGSDLNGLDGLDGFENNGSCGRYHEDRGIGLFVWIFLMDDHGRNGGDLYFFGWRSVGLRRTRLLFGLWAILDGMPFLFTTVTGVAQQGGTNDFTATVFGLVRGVYLFGFSRINTYFTRFSGGRHFWSGLILEWFDFFNYLSFSLVF